MTEERFQEIGRINPFNYLLMEIWNELLRYRQFEDGWRLVELPCLLGATVWMNERRTSGKRDKNGQFQINIYQIPIKFRFDMLPDVGKTVFLTEPEAQAALELQKGEQP